jgi:hypothetical protein
MAVSIIGDSGFAEYGIMGDSFMAVSIMGDSGFAEYDIIGDSFIAVSIIGDSRFAEYGIGGNSIMALSIIGDSGSVFLPLYTKFRYSKVSAPPALAIRQYQQSGHCSHELSGRGYLLHGTLLVCSQMQNIHRTATHL